MALTAAIGIGSAFAVKGAVDSADASKKAAKGNADAIAAQQAEQAKLEAEQKQKTLDDQKLQDSMIARDQASARKKLAGQAKAGGRSSTILTQPGSSIGGTGGAGYAQAGKTLLGS